MLLWTGYVMLANNVCVTVHSFICLLQNENVRRECTSERLVQGMRRPDRRTPVRVLVEKSFNFAGEIWRAGEKS